MNLRFAEESDYPAIVRFNDRVEAGGRPERITLTPGLPGENRYRPEGFPLFRRLMIAEDGDEIRAAMLLLHNSAYVYGQERMFCWADNPICEGIVNRRHSLAIVQVVKKALAYQPFLMSIGIGSLDEDIARFLDKLGWKHRAIPFLFYPVKATSVLRDLGYLNKHPSLRLGARLGAYTGMGIALSGALALRRRLSRGFSNYESTQEPAFEDWADHVFTESMADYGVAIRSDATALNILYPPDDPRYIRLRVRRKDTKEDVGWIIVVNKRMQDNAYFGSLKVGTLVNGFGRAADIAALVAAGTDYLAQAGVDLIVANFSHSAWVRASRRVGFLPGPSNYYVFASPGSAPLLDTSCPLQSMHLTRGHSDGLWSLI